MKFGKVFVFPDPDSRVKFEPLKLVETLECFFFAAHIWQDPTNMGSDRGKFTKVNLSISAGARCVFLAV